MNIIFTRLFKFTKLRVASFFILYQFYYNHFLYKNIYFNCFEDHQIVEAKKRFNNEIFNMKKKYGTQITNFPEIIIEIKGNVYIIKFLIDQRKCDMFSIIIEFLEYLKNDNKIKINNKIESFSHNNWKTFNLNFIEDNKGIKTEGSLSIIGEFSVKRPSFELILEKKFDLTQKDIDLVIKLYENSIKPSLFKDLRNMSMKETHNQKIKKEIEISEDKENNKIYKKLKKLGVEIYLNDSQFESYDWSNLAGYESQKRDIEDTIILSLTNPDLFDNLTKQTRMRFENNRTKAVLFEGPPGTGKTTSAKIIAKEAGIPLLYLSVESIMSKYYGEAEKNLSKVFELADKLGKSIIFIDEIDSIAISRDGDIHEASRRILSTLMKKLDSFESNTDLMLICATNRKKDLDNAIISRLDLSILFDLPDLHSRKEIFRRYAKQLDDKDLEKLSEKSEGFSGRDIYEICKDAERKFISSKLRNEIDFDLPILDNYLNSLNRIKNK